MIKPVSEYTGNGILAQLEPLMETTREPRGITSGLFIFFLFFFKIFCTAPTVPKHFLHYYVMPITNVISKRKRGLCECGNEKQQTFIPHYI